MPSHRRNGHAFPGVQSQLPAFRKIYRQATLHNDEQLVRGRVIVPAVRLVEDGEPQAADIDPIDDHVPISLRDSCAFRSQVHDVKGRISYRLLRVVLCRDLH